MSATRDIYSAPELYDALHWWKTNDLEFITERATQYGSPVLELAAGTGRLARVIAACDLDYTGLELSPHFAAAAREKLKSFGSRSRIVEADMRDFDLERQFKFILIGFNSFLHLYSDEDARDCLQAVKRHLHREGRFLIEIFIPDPWFLDRPKDRLYEVSTFAHPEGGYCQIKESNEFDAASGINHIDWYFFQPTQPEPERFSFDMRIYYPDTMDRLLAEAGLTVYEKLGDYDGNPLDADSELQIYICGK